MMTAPESLPFRLSSALSPAPLPSQGLLAQTPLPAAGRRLFHLSIRNRPVCTTNRHAFIHQATSACVVRVHPHALCSNCSHAYATRLYNMRSAMHQTHMHPYGRCPLPRSWSRYKLQYTPDTVGDTRRAQVACTAHHLLAGFDIFVCHLDAALLGDVEAVQIRGPHP